MKMETTTWVLIALLLLTFLIYDYWKKCHFKRLGVPADTALPIIGHVHLMIRQGFMQYILAGPKKHGKIYGMFNGSSPIWMISDADMLKEILIRQFSHFYNRRDTKIDDAPFHKALIRLEGARWKEVRNTITPAFSASKMRPIAGLINNACDSLVSHMKSAAETNPEMEVKGRFGDMTMDAIAQAAFGLQIDSQQNPDSPFVQHAKSIVQLKITSFAIFVMLFCPSLAPVLNYFKIGVFPWKAKQFFMDVTRKAADMREKGDNKHVDILQLMLDAKHSSIDADEESEEIPEMAGDHTSRSTHKADLTEDEIMAQAMVFFIAGYETTNVALTLISYHLAVHPNLQERLYAEVQKMAPTREDVTYDTVNKMEYLDMFINETMRLYPPSPVADRVCTETVTVGDYTIPKGAEIFYNIIALHRDPDYWEDPEKFDPERFSKEGKQKIHPFAFLPFGTGPRNCIGMRFAVLLVKAVVVRMVQEFQFEPCAKTPIPFKLGARTIVPFEGIHLRVVPRK